MNSKQRRTFNRKFKHRVKYPDSVHSWREGELKAWCNKNSTGEFVVDAFGIFCFSNEKDAIFFKLAF